tara:strand:+ start:315 stop:587 length:273 start_codon:yes stop_codon:yes gene_type:complete
MKKIIFYIILFYLYLSSYNFADTNNCKDLNKFSVEYLKCKGKFVKDKTISAGQNIIEDTKEYQNKEWSEQKEKLDKVKEKINKTKEKVLN